MIPIMERLTHYDPAKDSVGTTLLRIEHEPGHANHMMDFCAGIVQKAGVYFAEIEHSVFTPTPAAPAVAEPSGEAHGEPEIQPEHIEPEAASVGQGSEPEESGAEASRSDPGEDSGVAGSSGEDAAAGPFAGGA